jgi:hypothetical protein
MEGFPASKPGPIDSVFKLSTIEMLPNLRPGPPSWAAQTQFRRDTFCLVERKRSAELASRMVRIAAGLPTMAATASVPPVSEEISAFTSAPQQEKLCGICHSDA